MDTKQAYNVWASQYDTNLNKTRDLEAMALRTCLAAIPFDSCLEIGCGTGKNTEWLMERAQQVTAVDFSEEMLARASKKIHSGRVLFRQADINKDWTFRDGRYGLVSFSLVLEHIRELGHVFGEASKSLLPGGYIYIGELHPFKQYSGSKARFDTDTGQQIVECFTHHISDFTGAAKKHGLEIVSIGEWFDGDDRMGIPRILAMLLRKNDPIL
ncbi:MAG TPA: class I SAM-dependent methyltransferase [Puia sp.]|nr:class I SAM-dependent methyltransferase [Puia sp.]